MVTASVMLELRNVTWLIFHKFLHMPGCKLSKDIILTYISVFFIAYILCN